MEKYRLIQIAVFGSRKLNGKQKLAKKIAYEVGKEIAERGYVLISGGRTGVMEYSCKGCVEHGGIAIGILPEKEMTAGNSYCTVKIPTSIGLARNYINAHACDGAIVIAGSSGTLIECLIANNIGKPLVCFPSTGSTAKQIAGKVIAENGKLVKAVKTPKEALDWLERQILGKKKSK